MNKTTGNFPLYENQYNNHTCRVFIIYQQETKERERERERERESIPEKISSQGDIEKEETDISLLMR